MFVCTLEYLRVLPSAKAIPRHEIQSAALDFAFTNTATPVDVLRKGNVPGSVCVLYQSQKYRSEETGLEYRIIRDLDLAWSFVVLEHHVASFARQDLHGREVPR